MEFILVIFIYAGALSNTDSVTVTNIPGYTSLAECQTEGKKAYSLTQGTAKDTRFVCLQQKKS